MIKEPIDHIGKCSHVNKVFAKGKAGYECPDCGYFVTLASWKNNKWAFEKVAEIRKGMEEEKLVDLKVMCGVIEPPPILTKEMDAPSIQMVELPKAIFDLRSGRVLSESIGEKDHVRYLEFIKLLKTHSVHSFVVYNTNFIFYLEKK